jgi:propionate CoA-transferase
VTQHSTARGPAPVVTADQAAQTIRDGATVASDGFTMMGVADELLAAIERRFLATGRPSGLTWVHAAGQSNGTDGLARLAHGGLLRRVVGPHWGLNPPMARLLGTSQVEAVCLPQGQLATLYRTIAARRPGQLSTVGLGTFVDPRLDGGRVNDAARSALAADHYVERAEVGGQEYLLYKAFPLDAAIIRADVVDRAGNLGQEDEPAKLDALALAQAARNSGGRVIAQVRSLTPDSDLPARQVAVPSALVDQVVLVSDPGSHHRPSDGFAPGDQALVTGRVSAAEVAAKLSLGGDRSARAAIGLRGARLVRPGDVINLGTGIPGDTVPAALASCGLLDQVHVTVESGVWGGIALGGVDFGCALHPEAIIPHAQQFDYYNGGGVDIAFMGVGQVDAGGDVNVSAFDGRVIGCGGFMDIVDGASRVCFLMSADSKHPKAVERVDHLTFSGAAALKKGHEVFLAAEHFTLRLSTTGWEVVDCDDTATARVALGRTSCLTPTGATLLNNPPIQELDHA